MRAKKSLGQHFLTDHNVARKIVDLLHPGPHEPVLEIGPGAGILTGLLLERFGERLYLVEIDRNAVRQLVNLYPSLSKRIILNDIVKFDFASIPGRKISVIGNLPYNVSSQIFFHFLSNRMLIARAVCMVQKEMAERIAAPPGTRNAGILSVLLQAYYEIAFHFTVTEKVFRPVPAVKSAVITLNRRPLGKLPCNEAHFFKVVKTCFGQRRKMIRNSIKVLTVENADMGDYATKRPEQLTVDDFVHLTLMLQSQIEASEKRENT